MLVAAVVAVVIVFTPVGPAGAQADVTTPSVPEPGVEVPERAAGR